MIGAEAKIARGYAAMKRGELEKAKHILAGIAHPRAKELLEFIEQERSKTPAR